ncbi:MAG: hypothetical protein RL616_2305, partial [Verrucomicrobiota bacterium]
EKTARGNNAPLTKVNSEFRIQNSELPLLGEHQKQNAALALATVKFLQSQIPVGEKQIHAGLANVNWPGRLQLVEKTNGQKILLDGAHNFAGVEALRAVLRDGAPEAVAPTLIVGFLGDKDWQPMCKILAPLAVKIFTVPVASERTADASKLANTFHTANPSAEVIVCKKLSEALMACNDEPFVVVTGSLYLIGEALELLGHSPTNTGERGLNEWSVKKV